MPRPHKKNHNKRISIKKCYVKLTRCDELKTKENTDMKKQNNSTTEKIMPKKRGRPPLLKNKIKSTTKTQPPPPPSPPPPPTADRRRTRLNASAGVSFSNNTESVPRKPKKKSIEKPLILTSKRTRKPNRRYINDNVVTKLANKNRNSDDDISTSEDEHDKQFDHNENTKKSKNKNIILTKKKNTDDDYKIDEDGDDDDDNNDDEDNDNNVDDNEDEDNHSEVIALSKSLRAPKKIVNYTGKPAKTNTSSIKPSSSLQIALQNALANVSKKRKLNIQQDEQEQIPSSETNNKVKRLKLNQESSTLSENSINNKLQKSQSSNVLSKIGGIVTSTPVTTKRFATSRVNEHKKPAILAKRSPMPSPITKLPSSAGTLKPPTSSSLSVTARAAVVTITPNTAAPNFKQEVPLKTSAHFQSTLNKLPNNRNQNVQGKQPMIVTKVASNNSYKKNNINDSQISLKPLNNKSTITRTTTTLAIQDFEQMPTFTIVNINDIINQKEDAVIQESVAHKKNLPQIQAVDKNTEIAKKINNIIINNKEILNNTKYKNNLNHKNNKIIELNDTTDDDSLSTLDSVTLFGSPSKKPNKKEAGAKLKTLKKMNTPPPKMGIANGQLKIINHNNKNIVTKPQRILNSTLCNNQTPLTKLVSKVTSSSNNISNDNTKIVPVKQFPLTNRTTKENNLQNQNSTTNSADKSVDRPRLLRKVTCYETWFILHVEDDMPQKPPTFICEISLIQLGNRIKEINLPSPQWSYKISLQRKSLLLKSKTTNNVIKIKDDDDDDDDDNDENGKEEIYSGEVQDSALNTKTPEIYQPINIMFRREIQPNHLKKGNAIQTNQLKFQYDRAVIFRNQTFFLNIDGKSIRLIGAPLYIKTLKDVQILLEIVNDTNLNNPFVEYTNSLI